MDAKLVSMLKEPIRLPTDGMNTDIVSSNGGPTIHSAFIPPLSAKPVEHTEGDNNATIAIKRLYDSCMREGKCCW